MNKKEPKQQPDGTKRTRNVSSQSGKRRQNTLRMFEDRKGQSTSRIFVIGGKTRSSTKEGKKSDESNERVNRNCTRGAFTQNCGRFPQARQPLSVLNSLEKLARENPESLIRKLNIETLSRLLSNELKNNQIVAMMQIIAQVCRTDSSTNRAVLLTMTCTEENFWENLKKFILTLPYQAKDDRKKCRYWKNEGEFWTNVYTYCTTILNVIPTSACDVLQRLLIRVACTLENLEVSDNVKMSFEELQITLNKCRDELKSQKVIKHIVKPPDNFRCISLYPTCAEIMATEKTFLRKNVIKGSYNSVEHYLDVQFRLLREDFVAPLRKGVAEYMLKGKDHRRKVQNVKVYPKVCFLRPEVVNGIRGVLLQVNESNKNSNRRFMFGALLCFTSDNFKSIIFGRIINRDEELLRQGLLVVAFEGNFGEYVFNVDYLMVECKVYFEPYYHVLKALKSMTEENFPMKEYLVDVTCQVEYPDYYNQASSHKLKIGRRCEADVATTSGPDALKPRLNNSNFMIEDQYKVDLATDSWPEAEKLKLNTSQYSAFKNALSQKFVVIQGPPGTGKTYLGLFIARTLLENSELWKSGGPMLVVAYTNHALDQFLEGLLDTTSEIVRIGGQSKNEKLQQFNIKHLRVRSTTNPSSLMHDVVEEQLRIRKVHYANLETISKYEGIVDLSSFLHKRPELWGTWFEFAHAEDIGNWLLGREMNRMLNLTIDEVLQNLNAPLIDDHHNEASEEIFDNVNRAEHRFGLDDFNVSVSSDVAYIVKVEYLQQKIVYLQNTINFITIRGGRELDAFQRDAIHVLNKMGFLARDKEDILPCHNQLEEDLKQAVADLRYLEMRMDQGRSADSHVEPIEGDFHSPEDIVPEDRWRWYFYWLDEYKKYVNRKLHLLEERYQELYQEYEELRTKEDIEIMESRLVIGMTTTGAARLQASLQALKCPIVIVEEAAEILEAHTVASLTNNCQHLILIGDHQQLRPSTADYNIEKNFFLGISLFERMIMNGVQNNLLDVQHRMRPEIAKLIVPAIYPELKNHESVEGFSMVDGIIPCLYFITHSKKEEVSGDSSKTNLHEAKFLIQLARYLILNGYAPEDITILAAYSGQMFALFDERTSISLSNDVRITTLDNYQGEESKIILLSLVRNNAEERIGFLAIENRVCVALSRARQGFYMMGNIDLLVNKSEVWQKVNQSLEAQNAVGISLALRCQNHPSTITRVKTADDFKKVPQGGCNEICRQILKCGHSCNVKCHLLDREHQSRYRCKQKCAGFPCDHPCPKLCFEDCGLCTFPVSKLLPCGHEQDVACHLDPKDLKCAVLILSKLACGHEVNRKCYKDISTVTCPQPCNTKIERCGHLCHSRCHFRTDPDHLEEHKCKEKCQKDAADCTMETSKHLCPLLCGDKCLPCKIAVEKTRTACSHFFKVPCSIDVDKWPCQKPCKKELPCGHPCKLKCADTCGKCQVIVEKTLPKCNHKVTVRCSEGPTRAICIGKCPRLLPCGHPCSATCKQKCTQKCQTLIESPLEADCGHTFKIPCYLRNEGLASNDMKLLQHCREPCTTTLKCGHTCSGTCPECHQGRIHKSCAKRCSTILICGHKCLLLCHQICQPCNLPYTNKCVHSKRRMTCGELRPPCRHKCFRRCKHVRCTARCGDKCTVPPCSEPCKKILKCGHLCIGFCNDPCPKLCRVCNKRELTKGIILGFEEDEDARFVLLEECGHVIESRAMERWLQSDGDQIINKRCPTCHTSLSFTRRYADYIKESFADISKVKRKFYGNVRDNEQIRVELLQKLGVSTQRKLGLFQSFEFHLGVGQRLVSPRCFTTKLKLQQELQSLKHKKSKQFSVTLLKMSSKIQIYQQIYELFHKSTAARQNVKCISYLDFLLDRLMKDDNNCITTQEVQDFECELKRLCRMLQLSEIEKDKVFANPRLSNSEKLYGTLLPCDLYSARKYNVEDDSKIKQCLTELAAKLSLKSDISDVELKKIDKIVGANRGVWYKCTNGHLYAVDRPEEADQMLPTCNECGTNE